jgi:feruloyl-CoA synthase
MLIGTALGCTESCPSALFASEPGGFAGLVGVPVPGMELKLAPLGEKLEARYRGKNIFPGYWKQPELTEGAFDEEGFYCTGDALRFADPSNVNKGMIFDGRFSEDFKLSTGTWVRVGLLRSQLIAASGGLIRDAVITGHDRDFIGAIIFPAMEFCKKLPGLENVIHADQIIQHHVVKESLKKVLQGLANKATGSAGLIRRAVFADFDLSKSKAEITEKGSINQRMVISNHADLVEELYEELIHDNIIEV